LKSEFFPATDEDIFAIDIEGQPGQKIEVTSDIAKQVESTLKGEKDIDSFTTTV
jgi:multidrug efflux pump subunit AcrB